MRKITLQLEALTVESFDTTTAEAPDGTVLAYNRTEGCTNTCGQSCFNTGCTCYATCFPVSCPDGTCWDSCGGTCYEQSCQC